MQTSFESTIKNKNKTGRQLHLHLESSTKKYLGLSYMYFLVVSLFCANYFDTFCQPSSFFLDFNFRTFLTKKFSLPPHCSSWSPTNYFARRMKEQIKAYQNGSQNKEHFNIKLFVALNLENFYLRIINLGRREMGGFFNGISVYVLDKKY